VKAKARVEAARGDVIALNLQSGIAGIGLLCPSEELGKQGRAIAALPVLSRSHSAAKIRGDGVACNRAICVCCCSSAFLLSMWRSRMVI
jgi:hypothetical protein